MSGPSAPDAWGVYGRLRAPNRVMCLQRLFDYRKAADEFVAQHDPEAFEMEVRPLWTAEAMAARVEAWADEIDADRSRPLGRYAEATGIRRIANRIREHLAGTPRTPGGET